MRCIQAGEAAGDQDEDGNYGYGYGEREDDEDSEASTECDLLEMLADTLGVEEDLEEDLVVEGATPAQREVDREDADSRLSDISISDMSSDCNVQDLELQLSDDCNEAAGPLEDMESEAACDDDELVEEEGAGPRPRSARDKSGGVRGPQIAEEVFRLPHIGELHFSISGSYLRAHCRLHGEACRRQRTVLPSEWLSRKGQGRPVGHLVSWLQKAPEAATSEEHIKFKVPQLSERRAGRSFLYSQAGGQEFAAAHERVREYGEDEEPTTVP